MKVRIIGNRTLDKRNVMKEIEMLCEEQNVPVPEKVREYLYSEGGHRPGLTESSRFSKSIPCG